MRFPGLAKGIADGHAFEKHVDEFAVIQVETREQFARHIENVVNKPTATRDLRRGRSAYWDEGTGTVVIKDPSSADGGTAFRPRTGRSYFEGLR